MKKEMMKLGKINTWEKVALLLGYNTSNELEKDIMLFTEELMEDGKLEGFCYKQNDYITREIFDMNSNLMKFATYRKILSYILEEELGLEVIIDIFGEVNMNLKILEDYDYILNDQIKDNWLEKIEF